MKVTVSRSSLRRAGTAALALSLAATSLPASNTSTDASASAPSAAPKTHTLYMGTDYFVQWEGQLRPVLGVEGKAFVVSVDGKRVMVPSTLTDLQIKVDSALKLSTGSATIAKLEADRGYTYANDPSRRVEEGMALITLADAAVDTAEETLRANEPILAYGAATHLDALGRPDPLPAPNLMSGAEGQAIQAAVLAQNSVNISIPAGVSRSDSQALQEQYDAFHVTFQITSREPLTNAYAVLEVHYLLQAGHPESERTWIYPLALPRVDASRRKVSFSRGGFSPGFEIKDVFVHVYDQRGEVATNVSPRRVELTADEAFQYSIVEYLSDKRDKTVGPVPARAFWPMGLRERVQAGKWNGIFYVKVSKEGNPTGGFEDAACTKKVADPDLAALISELRFYPALNKGKMSPGIASLELSRLDN